MASGANEQGRMGFWGACAVGAQRLPTGLGALACLAALVVLLVHAAEASPAAVWLFAAFVGSAFLFELTLCRLLGRPIDIEDDDA